jgi:hypothetical protein
LQASLLARLDRLAPVREVAQIGAALGRQFSHELAATVEDRFPQIVAAQPALLAHHCTEAGLTEKAIAYWLAAGRQAWGRSIFGSLGPPPISWRADILIPEKCRTCSYGRVTQPGAIRELSVDHELEQQPGGRVEVIRRARFGDNPMRIPGGRHSEARRLINRRRPHHRLLRQKARHAGMRDDPAIKDYFAWVKKWFPGGNAEDPNYGYHAALALEYVLRQCGDDLTRENVMRVATHLDHVAFPMLLPGITASTSPTDYFPLKRLQMLRFDGEAWVPFGPIRGPELVTRHSCDRACEEMGCIAVMRASRCA